MDSKKYEANLRRVKAGLEEVRSVTPTGINRSENTGYNFCPVLSPASSERGKVPHPHFAPIKLSTPMRPDYCGSRQIHSTSPSVAR